MVLFFKRLAVLVLLVCLGCSAQSNSTEANHRVERLVRSYYTVPPSVDVEVTSRKASSDFQGWDELTVKLSRGEQTTTRQFLLSKDGEKLMQLNKVEDPMKKIDWDNRPWRGNKDAKVVLVNFDDFQCPFCARNHQQLMTDILKTYGDKIKIVYKDFPLVEIHPWAMRAAIDSNCLAEQNNDAYWDFADYAHANQKEITGAAPVLPANATDEQKRAAAEKQLAGAFDRLDKATLDAGKKHNLNTARLDSCVKAQNDSVVQASRKQGDDLGLSATPTMFVNGEKLDGAVPEPEMKLAINRAFRDAGVPLPANTNAAAPAPAQPATH